jgi:outer membrane murein-binding lipoprotein Lpp
MKKIAHVILFGVVACGLAMSSAVAQSKKDKAQTNVATTTSQSKVSKADAEALVLKRNPGATVLNSNEATVNGHKVWSVSVSTTGGNVARKVYVDQDTGKLSY